MRNHVLLFHLLFRGEGESCSVLSDSLQPHGLHSPWNSPGQNTGVSSLSLLQWIFPTQESNQCLPRCRWILYQLNHKRSPRILEWVAYPFSSGSSQPRNWTRVSCVAGGLPAKPQGKPLFRDGKVLLENWSAYLACLYKIRMCGRTVCIYSE